MGVLNVTTPAKVRTFSTLPEVIGLSDDVRMQQIIDRAEFIASRLFDYDNTLTGYTLMLEYAIDMLVENLVVISTPAFKRSGVAKLRSEQIGSYSYTKSQDAKGAVSDLMSYMNSEVWFILNAYKVLTSPHMARDMTRVFVPRTMSIDSSGIHYFIPEDATVQTTSQDPPFIGNEIP
jgi:hypothetical protein